MPQKGGSKKAPAKPKGNGAAGTPPDASPLAIEPKVKKRGHKFTDTEDVPTNGKKVQGLSLKPL
jgi:hypothetical protein